MIARSVAAGLGKSMDVDLVEVGAAPTTLPEELDRLVIGALTHAFTLSRESSREEAARRLRAKGVALLMTSERFLVADIDGPVVMGEEGSARTWGAELAAEAIAREAAVASRSG